MAEHNAMNSHKIPFASIGSMVGLRGRREESEYRSGSACTCSRSVTPLLSSCA